ncbi:MAG TPA: phosphoribosyltransferase [Chloroflexi bacterium]|jgi:putative phosphoribosyl transferase|nr:phosphoribosyltransferase [Chloroflexota bacterium]
MFNPLFRDRSEAGRVLAERLSDYEGRDDLLVLGLPRGGLPVAYEVARALHAALDVFVVRKLGVPGQEELAMGAIASGGIRVLNEDVVRMLGISQKTIERVAAAEEQELERRERAYRGDLPPVAIEGRHVILVDDGLATGATMRAAIAAARQKAPSGVTVAVPAASSEACAALAREVDAIVCAATPEPFVAIGIWYADFRQISDAEVRALLAAAEGWLTSQRQDEGAR